MGGLLDAGGPWGIGVSQDPPGPAVPPTPEQDLGAEGAAPTGTGLVSDGGDGAERGDGRYGPP